MLLGAPWGYLDALRMLVSVLLAAGGALRAWRWQARRSRVAPGVAFALAFALLALCAAWSGAQVGAGPEIAIGTACALELFGGGTLWLGEGLMADYRRPVIVDAATTLRVAATQMA